MRASCIRAPRVLDVDLKGGRSTLRRDKRRHDISSTESACAKAGARYCKLACEIGARTDESAAFSLENEIMKRVRIAVIGAGTRAEWGVLPVLSGPDIASPPDTGAWWARRADANSSSEIRYQPPAIPEVVALCDSDRARFSCRRVVACARRLFRLARFAARSRMRRRDLHRFARRNRGRNCARFAAQLSPVGRWFAVVFTRARANSGNAAAQSHRQNLVRAHLASKCRSSRGASLDRARSNRRFVGFVAALERAVRRADHPRRRIRQRRESHRVVLRRARFSFVVSRARHEIEYSKRCDCWRRTGLGARDERCHQRHVGN